MTLSRTLGFAALAACLVGGSTLAGQNRVPGPDQAGLAQTKAMQTGVEACHRHEHAGPNPDVPCGDPEPTGHRAHGAGNSASGPAGSGESQSGQVGAA